MGNFSKEKLANRIREEIKRHGDSHKALGDKIGMSSSEISKMLKGERNISVEKLVSIADAYGMSVDDLLDRSTKISIENICRSFANMDRALNVSIAPTKYTDTLRYDKSHNPKPYEKPGEYIECSVVFPLREICDNENNVFYYRYAINKFLHSYAVLRDAFKDDPEQLQRQVDALIDGLR